MQAFEKLVDRLNAILMRLGAMSDMWRAMRTSMRTMVLPSSALAHSLPQAAERVAHSMAEHLGHIEFHDRMLGLPGDAEMRRLFERELSRFFVLNRAAPNRRYSITGKIDMFWHALLEHPEAYRRFCRAAFAIDAVEHRPARPGEKWTPGYIRFYGDYQRVYGEMPPYPVWHRLGGSKGAYGSSASGCGGGCSGGGGCGGGGD